MAYSDILRHDLRHESRGRRLRARYERCRTPTIRKVIDQLPNAECRLAVALARFAGLRCPSEISLLKWSEINWHEGRMLVHAPKTKRKGKPTRIVPLFPELRPFLEDAFEAAADGAVQCVKYSSDGIRHHLKRAIDSAGVERWEKLFVNLRSSRQTELVQAGFPAHVVCEWLGNTTTVANKHYLQVNDADFAAALELPADPTVEVAR